MREADVFSVGKPYRYTGDTVVRELCLWKASQRRRHFR